MNFEFAEYLTPQDVVDRGMMKDTSVSELVRMSKVYAKCSNCNNFEAWRMADLGMCFACVTGESDASEDFELVEEDYFEEDPDEL